ncbi:MAG: hypothetical protein ACYTCU_10165 [Planctomycetota bacterium]
MTEAQESQRRNAQRMLRIDATLWGITAGLLLGIGLFVATNWLVFRGGPQVGKHLGLLGHYFIGYSVTFMGSLIGFVWAFASGFVAIWLLVSVYNFVALRRHGDPSA